MHDRGLFWSPVPDWSRAGIRHEWLSIAALAPQAAWLVSGDLAAFLQRRGLRFGDAGNRYALRLAPDRLLFVSMDGVEDVAFGWSDGCAVTDISDGYVLLDITGPAAPELMRLGTLHDFEARSDTASAGMLFAGQRVILARIAHGWRLHVERPDAAAIWQWLQRAASEWGKPPTDDHRSKSPPLHATQQVVS
ncbi:MAG TPA: sarcosine oxidase subunit gamma family protein [Dongiaceae bacterium]|nr:sarcosine oxidase subunit gamma family protein [Dongiaceae bacterium]